MMMKSQELEKKKRSPSLFSAWTGTVKIAATLKKYPAWIPEIKTYVTLKMVFVKMIIAILMSSQGQVLRGNKKRTLNLKFLVVA